MEVKFGSGSDSAYFDSYVTNSEVNLSKSTNPFCQNGSAPETPKKNAFFGHDVSIVSDSGEFSHVFSLITQIGALASDMPEHKQRAIAVLMGGELPPLNN
ncbi:hypothetical protein [uncultured Endozoicomonas sp.]|uniref:hypothetical protein n=1 Tax=uncultured Endozoicomonas sp. TaxID=432652 RepID=UPI0026144EF5|nr:hypothetical protein [uncultured Endozoicomonas sp.]